MTAQTYPMAAATFASLLKIKSVTFLPSYGQEYSGQATGVILAKDLRPRLWNISLTTVPMDQDDANDFLGRIEALDGSINTFLMYNPKRAYPRAGLTTDAGVTIASLNADGKQLSLTGLPVGATLQWGDMLGFQYGSPNSYGLYRIVGDPVVADSTGTTPDFELAGGIRPGAATGLAVSLIKPLGEFRVNANSLKELNQTDPLYNSYSFTAIQVLY